jgi:peptidoglycan hydrolase CwlO-like protein
MWCAVLACALYLACAGVAQAEPTTTTPSGSPAIDALRAEEAAAQQALEQMRIDLSIQVAEYIEVGKLMERNKVEIAQSTIDLAQAEIELEAIETALRKRAVELYRGERLDILGILLSSRSIQDLWVRANYLTKITARDATLITDVRLARTEALWLRESLLNKMDALRELQRDADSKREKIEVDLEQQEKRAEQLRVDLARLLWSPAAGGGSAPQRGFNPDTIISEAAFRDSSSMNAEQIQAFLEEQPGSLATYQARDPNGKLKPASQLIADAAVAWNINPKVLLIKLQKEQSLLQKANPSQRAYDWALGVGKTDSRTISKFKGFGMQVWGGAQTLDKHADRWSSGTAMTIDGSAVLPTNAATYSLYKYTPHLRGNMSFWLLYWRYFGDPSI